METKSERQRRLRAIPGSPAREAMLRWRKSERSREVWRKYAHSERGRETIRKSRRKGTPGYEKRQEKRLAFRIVAHNGRRRWTDGDEQRLRELVAEGRTEPEIATMLGRSLSGIMHKKRKMGLTVSVDSDSGADA
jgi:hypothetical protein